MGISRRDLPMKYLKNNEDALRTLAVWLNSQKEDNWWSNYSSSHTILRNRDQTEYPYENIKLSRRIWIYDSQAWFPKVKIILEEDGGEPCSSNEQLQIWRMGTSTRHDQMMFSLPT